MIIHLALFFMLVYLLSLYFRDMSIVDVAWGLGFILLVTLSYFSGPMKLLNLVVYTMVVLWGLRLSWHIFSRHKGEDWRYKNWRKQWGKTVWWRSLLQVFVLQAIILYIVSLPAVVLAMYPLTLNGWMIIGFIVWVIGLTTESVADWQVRQHRKTSKTIYRDGLWRYSRHPNYFGEAMQWWGLTIMCAPLILSYNLWWVGASPILITYLLRFVSGVPMLEKKFMKATGYKEYMAKTNAFIPWFPK